MAAPRLVSGWWLRDRLVTLAAFFLLLLSLATGAEEGSSTADFDVRPGGMVHTFSRSLVSESLKGGEKACGAC